MTRLYSLTMLDNPPLRCSCILACLFEALTGPGRSKTVKCTIEAELLCCVLTVQYVPIKSCH